MRTSALDAPGTQRVSTGSLRGWLGSELMVRPSVSMGNTVAHLEPVGPSRAVLANPASPSVHDARNAAVAIVSQEPALFRMSKPAEALHTARFRVDTLGMTHVRLEQHVSGVPVFGAELMFHFDKAGRLGSIDANYLDEAAVTAVRTEPTIDAEAARSAARAHFRATRTGAPESSVEVPMLVVFAPSVLGGAATAPRLAYHLEVRDDVIEAARFDYMIDAHTGEVLQALNNLQEIAATGRGVMGDTKTFEVTQQGASYVMRDTSRTPNGILTYTSNYQQTIPGALVTSNSLTTWDATGNGAGSAVDAHAYAAAVYDYYKKTFNRNGLDGQNTRMVSSVHYGNRYANAFWNGQQMAYGDGDGTIFRSLAAGLDVIAHEFTHGLTQSESNLVYQNQSGALNEAVSDIFGALVEASVKVDPVKNWQMGEVVGISGPLRDMAHPGLVARGKQPTHMAEYLNLPLSQDNGGVHINSGIINNAAYLMMMGGTNDRSKANVPKGIGLLKGGQLWYRANTQYLMQSSNFQACAQATKTAANDLGFSEEEKAIVDCAWQAVGILQGTCNVQASSSSSSSSGGATSGSSGAQSSTSSGGSGDPGAGAPGAGAPLTLGEQEDEPQGGCATGEPRNHPAPSSAAVLGVLGALYLLRRRRAAKA